MKAFIFIICSLCLVGIARGEGEVIDPTETPQMYLVCDMPVTREDGTVLAIDEIARVDFLASSDGVTWTAAGSEAQCRTSLDFSAMSDGQYYYAVAAVDTEGRVSERADSVPFVLKRVRPPSSPTNLRLQP